jgi:hypothetical protein
MSVRDTMRRWLKTADRAPARAFSPQTLEALRRAGSQDIDAAQQAALDRALAVVAGDGDVIVGPWTGEVGFELMYWIPFLGWLQQQGLRRERIVALSRGGAGLWYQHLTSRYVDILDLISPDEFRERNAGKKKQYDRRRELDRELVKKTRDRLGIANATVVHPSAMFRLFSGLWRKRATIELVEAFSSFTPLSAPASIEPPPGLPSDYVVAKFYFSKAFPETMANRMFVTETLRKVSADVPVALLSTAVRLDEHSDYESASGSGLFVVDAHETPQRNLERQTQLITGARGFIGTYGGFSYLAPFYGVPSLSFFSHRDGFESHHLDLAHRVFDRMLPGGFLSIDRSAADLIDPAVDRWCRREPARQAEERARRAGVGL